MHERGPAVPAACETRRVLMLCYYFPPLQTSAIARHVGFARHLPDAGWSPRVLTVTRSHDVWGVAGTAAPVPAGIAIERAPEWPLNEAVDFADGALNRVRGWLGRDDTRTDCRDLFCIPDPQIAWRARSAATRLARASDAIYAGCSPFSAALVGLAASRRSGRPLVVDFRDAWTMNPHRRARAGWHERAIRRLERRVIAGSARVILNTEGARQLYRAAYPEFADRFDWVPNGFDGLNLPAPSERGNGDTFTVMHVGTLYGNRDPRLLLEAMADLQLPGARFVQVGQTHPTLEAFADRVPIETLGQVTPEQALAHMRRADLLYLKQGWEPGTRDYVAVAAKTYEYLVTGVPVLAECPPGDNADLVARHARHAHVVDSPDGARVRAALRAAWDNRRAVEPAIDRDFVATFDRRALARRLGGILDAVAGGRT